MLYDFVLTPIEERISVMNEIRIKRIYEPSSEEDGYRVLVDRLWPRGVTKERADIDYWAKNISPSSLIRKEFNHRPELMDDFKIRYVIELDNNEYAMEFAGYIREKLDEGNATLLYAAKDEKINHAVILKEWLEEHNNR
jgi:uncharacterized protein YeaO (DUF488 family)